MALHVRWPVFSGVLSVLGVSVHADVWYRDWGRDAICVLGFGLSWRQRPIVLFRWTLGTPYGGWRVWLEWWSGHREWLPTSRASPQGR